MAYATVQDVKRYLDLEDEDVNLQPYLDSAIERVRRHIHQSFGEAQKTESFFDVRADDLLNVHDEAPAGVSVSVFLTPNSSATALSAAQFQVVAGGRVRLYLSGVEYEFNPLALSERLPRRFARAEVTYTPSTAVPATVREATAELAAMMYAQRGQNVAGISSERLGDYSYSRASETSVQDSGLPDAVRKKLAPYRRAPIAST